MHDFLDIIIRELACRQVSGINKGLRNIELIIKTDIINDG